jgi:hypothetical protein
MMRITKIVAKAIVAASFFLLASDAAFAETCTTQSLMAPADRDALATAARDLAGRMQAGDAPGLRAVSVAEVAKDFAAITDVVSSTAPRLKGGNLVVDQVYLLDASTLKRAADGSASDAQFFCTLNRSTAEADFLIPALPPGKYAFAIVDAKGIPAPWRLSFLFRQEQGKWLMAGLYPKPATAGGHDGLWYWTQARQMSARKEPWNAWLYFQQADALLQPAGFVQSTHLEKLHTEATAAQPPVLSAGITNEAPLVVKAKDGTEYRLTSLSVDDSLGAASVDVAVHIKVDPIADQAVARKRNIAAMAALLAAYPELRKPFHGIWVFADAPGQNAYATEQAMNDIP